MTFYLPLPEPTEDTRGRALMCCGARVSCLLHRPCPVPILAPSQDGKTALHFAAMKGAEAAIKLLFANGADLNTKDWVRTPLRSLLTGGKERGRKGAALHESLS